MTNKRLKILIAVMVIILVFIFWYNQGHSEDIINEMQVSVLTGETVEEVVPTTPEAEEEQIIYTWEMTEQRLAEQVNRLVGNYDISYTIVHECSLKVKNYKKCIQDVVGVSNAESSIFQKGMHPSNNGFWLMMKTKNGYIKRKFSSVEEGIKYRVNLYAEKWREKRTTGQDWLNWKYCTSECKWRTKNYSSAIKKLGELD